MSLTCCRTLLICIIIKFWQESRCKPATEISVCLLGFKSILHYYVLSWGLKTYLSFFYILSTIRPTSEIVTIKGKRGGYNEESGLAHPAATLLHEVPWMWNHWWIPQK